MPLPVYRLRRLLALTAILLTIVVTTMIFYARSRTKNVLQTIPGKIGLDIKQTAKGFQISKSDGKRTLFTVEASDLKQFKINGNAELHNVSIILYGRDSARYDQIYGDDFAYDQKTGDVTAQGEVQIDLVANPAGLASPDQTVPKEMKNPIHLKTRDLVFNKDTGNAFTPSRVEFRTPQASGWAVGAHYAGKTNTLTLSSQIHVELTGPHAAVVEAQHGIITSDPREIVLDNPHLDRADGKLQADRASFSLDSDNHVQRVLASGNVNIATRMRPAQRRASPHNVAEPPAEMRGRADQAEFLFRDDEDLLRTASLQGNVHIEQGGAQPIEGGAGKVILDFAGQNELQKVHAVDGAHLAQKASPKSSQNTGVSPAQDFDLTAPVIDFTIAEGRILRRAVTSGTAQITINQTSDQAKRPSEHTVVTAGVFDAAFSASDGRSYLSSIHGAPNARIVNSAAGQPDRVTTSDSVDAVFPPQGGIDTLIQKGNFTYSDGQAPAKQMRAWSDTAHYTPADQMLILNGSPRIQSAGMATTAKTVRINRATGDAVAEGDVKTSYSELKEQPNGALLASSSPIHVTSRAMTARNNSGMALYEGNARLWQDANVIEAPSIEFDRDHRFVTALGSSSRPVQTLLVQTEKAGQKPKSPTPSTTIAITAAKLTYADSERKVHYEGGVLAKSADFSASARAADAFLLPRSMTSTASSLSGPGHLDGMVAQGDVTVQQPKRRAEGQQLIYTAADDKFILTGGPPSIFDAEQGKITGVSLTFFRRDDRVLVEGEARNPVVTQTRVAP